MGARPPATTPPRPARRPRPCDPRPPRRPSRRAALAPPPAAPTVPHRDIVGGHDGPRRDLGRPGEAAPPRRVRRADEPGAVAPRPVPAAAERVPGRRAPAGPKAGPARRVSHGRPEAEHLVRAARVPRRRPRAWPPPAGVPV